MASVVAVVVLLAAAPVPVGWPAPSTALSEDKAVLDKARRMLREPWPDARRRAVKKLAALGSPRAWELVRDALEDDEPEVADEAQIALGTVTDPQVLRGLLGRDGLRHGDPWVRLRVAEALGRVTVEVDGEALVRVLAPREVEVARALCWSLERLAKGGRLGGRPARIAGRLEPCLRRGRDGLLRADALAAIAALTPGASRGTLTEALSDDEPLLRAAAVTLLAEVGAAEACGAARHLARDEDRGVRAAAIEVWAAARSRAGVEALAQALEAEPRRRLRLRLAEHLRALSGLRYREDARPWKRWVAGLPADWCPAPAGTPATRAPSDEGRTVASLASIPLDSDRLCILVDLSGSLWAERTGGRTRKELLDDQLLALLERLAPEAHFNLIPYATSPEPWQKALVPATARNVKAAAREFERCRITGKGNVWDAARLALADPGVDTLLVITDGAPTGGPHWNLELMTELLTWERRWRSVAVSSVLVDASKRLQRSWTQLADRTGGTSTAVRFEVPAEKSRSDL